jgi:hypothetical protein
VGKTVDLQIRKMPALLRDRLRIRARGKGKTMSQYVIETLAEDLERPTIDEWLAEVRAGPQIPMPKGVTGLTLIREVREEEERETDAMVDQLIARRRSRGLTRK